MTLWKPDPQVQEARKLRDWPAFHEEAAKLGLAFDGFERKGRSITCSANKIVKTAMGGWSLQLLATGTGSTVLDALEQAYRESGITSDGLDSLMDGMRGVGEEFDALFDFDTAPAPSLDDFANLFD